MSIFTRKQAKVLTETEENLVQGCIEWDRQSQNMLYNTYSAKMFAVCFKYSSSREEAEDTFHEGFMKVFENIKSFRKEGSLEGWIRKIMVNTALEKYRKNSHLTVVVNKEINDVDLKGYSTEDILDRISADEMMQLIHKLPPQYKMVFNLHEFEGLNHREIAGRLNITVGSSKSNLSRAKAILQRAVKNNSRVLEEIIH